MKEELISLFIDDEMDMDEKIEFVEQVHADVVFKDSAIEFLHLEKDLRGDVVERLPQVRLPAKKPSWVFFRPMHLVAPSLAVAAALLLFVFWPVHQEASKSNEPYRFVIYRPDVSRAAISGDFTGWKDVPLQRIGSSGYWEISLSLSQGEHRYVFVLGGGERVPDPTVMTREQDDFGGENTVIATGADA
jgi:hypothetical protein